MTFTTERLPSHWASALINDDWTGYSEEECEALQSFIANELNGLHCVGVEEDSSFQQAPSYYRWLLAGDYSTFTFQEETEPAALPWWGEL